MKRILFNVTIRLWRDVSREEVRTKWDGIWERDISATLKSAGFDPVRVKVIIPKRRK